MNMAESRHDEKTIESQGAAGHPQDQSPPRVSLGRGEDLRDPIVSAFAKERVFIDGFMQSQTFYTMIQDAVHEMLVRSVRRVKFYGGVIVALLVAIATVLGFRTFQLDKLDTRLAQADTKLAQADQTVAELEGDKTVFAERRSMLDEYKTFLSDEKVGLSTQLRTLSSNVGSVDEKITEIQGRARQVAALEVELEELALQYGKSLENLRQEGEMAAREIDAKLQQVDSRLEDHIGQSRAEIDRQMALTNQGLDVQMAILQEKLEEVRRIQPLHAIEGLSIEKGEVEVKFGNEVIFKVGSNGSGELYCLVGQSPRKLGEPATQWRKAAGGWLFGVGGDTWRKDLGRADAGKTYRVFGRYVVRVLDRQGSRVDLIAAIIDPSVVALGPGS